MSVIFQNNVFLFENVRICLKTGWENECMQAVYWGCRDFNVMLIKFPQTCKCQCDGTRYATVSRSSQAKNWKVDMQSNLEYNDRIQAYAYFYVVQLQESMCYQRHCFGKVLRKLRVNPWLFRLFEAATDICRWVSAVFHAVLRQIKRIPQTSGLSFKFVGCSRCWLICVTDRNLVHFSNVKVSHTV